MDSLPLDLLAVGYTILVLLVQGVPIVLARRMPGIGPLGPLPDGAPPSVSAIIAARNEELDLGGALDDLLAQRGVDLEVVVVDGASTDGTEAVVRQRPAVRRIPEPPMPPGWVGKSWACQTGADATGRPWILFADADIRLHPTAVAATVAWAERERADLASLAPRLETRSFWERAVLPITTQMVLTYFRAPRTNLDRSRAAIANGQFLLVRRDAYQDVGGHASVAGFVLEDVALARRFRGAGRRLRFGWAPELLSTRMYRDRHEMFEGLLKNAHDTEFRLGRQLLLLTGLFATYLLPLAMLPVGLLLGAPVLIGLGAALWVVLFAKDLAFSRAVTGRARNGLGFPIGVAFYLAILATSIGRGVRGRPIRWKGGQYPLRAAPPPER